MFYVNTAYAHIHMQLWEGKPKTVNPKRSDPPSLVVLELLLEEGCYFAFGEVFRQMRLTLAPDAQVCAESGFTHFNY